MTHAQRVIAALGSLLGACGGSGGGTGLGTQPSWRQASAFEASTGAGVVGETIDFAPGGPGATYYALSPPPPPQSAIGEAVIAAVGRAATAAGMATPVADGRLFAAASALAPYVPDEGVVSYGLVEFALQHHGIIEPSPHLLVVWGDLDDPDEIVAQIAPRLPELLGSGADTRLGVGVAHRDGSGVVVFALQGSRVTIQPVARAVDLGRSTYLEGRVAAGFVRPEVFVTEPAGGVQRMPVRSVGTTDFVVEVPCASPGRTQIEITAEDATGSNVLANFPVWCAEPPPTSLRVDPTVDDVPLRDAADAEQRLLALVNRDRVRAGLPELRWHEGAAEVARRHSAEMHATGEVARVSPITGAAADRVRAAGLRTPTVLENVARAYGVSEVHAGLMGSPGHRANLLSSSATHLGIGVVLGDDISGRRELLVTQVFLRVPPPIEPAAAAAQVLAAARTVRPWRSGPSSTGRPRSWRAPLRAACPRDRVGPGQAPRRRLRLALPPDRHRHHGGRRPRHRLRREPARQLHPRRGRRRRGPGPAPRSGRPGDLDRAAARRSALSDRRALRGPAPALRGARPVVSCGAREATRCASASGGTSAGRAPGARCQGSGGPARRQPCSSSHDCGRATGKRPSRGRARPRRPTARTSSLTSTDRSACRRSRARMIRGAYASC
ncbi:MAG: CAP domain-containing protein [Kofleriaceae bacterium]